MIFYLHLYCEFQVSPAQSSKETFQALPTFSYLFTLIDLVGCIISATFGYYFNNNNSE